MCVCLTSQHSALLKIVSPLSNLTIFCQKLMLLYNILWVVVYLLSMYCMFSTLWNSFQATHNICSPLPKCSEKAEKMLFLSHPASLRLVHKSWKNGEQGTETCSWCQIRPYSNPFPDTAVEWHNGSTTSSPAAYCSLHSLIDTDSRMGRDTETE
jgi:hypothetical protein